MIRWNRVAGSVAAVLLVGGLTGGCRAGVDAGADPGAPAATPCSRVSPPPGNASQRPTVTRLAWRAEHLRDGSIRMTVGDVDAAPPDPAAVSTTDYRAPDDPDDCYDVKIVKVRGWWCATTVSSLAETGPIVVGGGAPRARVHSAGFRTACSGHAVMIRQTYQVQRDSWSGWRSYSDWRQTAWGPGPAQAGGPVSATCPHGRVGTYNYRLAVELDVEGYSVTPATAASATIRTSCGTGVS